MSDDDPREIFRDLMGSVSARTDQAHAAARDAQHEAHRRMVWAQAACCAIGNPNCPDTESAAVAGDAILGEFDKRFPSL